MSRFDLLPPNATTLERDFSRSTSSLERISAPVPTIRTAKRRNIPDSVVPWLVFEYGLAEILPYVADQRAALELGIPWQRVRGTPAAVAMALDWIDVIGEVAESEGGSYRWAEYQIGLAAPTTDDELIDRIVAVAALSSPVRSRLQRIYSVYDYRRFVLDFSLLSDGSPLSDHTGTRPQPDWPQISFGDYRASDVSLLASAVGGAVSWAGLFVTNQDRFLLSQGILDEEWHVINESRVRTDYIPITANRFDSPATWGATPWLPVPWEGSAYVVESTSVQVIYRVFALEAGGSILAEDVRILALEDYPE